jgi:2-dehydro-3-deoxyphosphogluconate aldolase/(4S)-4-hydroxy-2-oxoglutarate aldolase
MKEHLENLLSSRILPAVTIEKVTAAVPVARAILRGGLDVMEVPFRTPEAATCIREIIAQVPEMKVGAGTILNQSQLDRCREAGASFALAPGFNPSVVRYARDMGMPFIPGVMTPSEVESAFEMGCAVLKLFPASQLGGAGFLKALHGPYRHLSIRFIPMGGVGLSNMEDYLQQPNVLAVGGSWLAPKSLIRTQNWEQITSNVREGIVKCVQSANR